MKGPGPSRGICLFPTALWSGPGPWHTIPQSVRDTSGVGVGGRVVLSELRALESPWMVVGTHLVPEIPDAALGCCPPLLSQCPLLTTSDPDSTELEDNGLRLEGEVRVG